MKENRSVFGTLCSSYDTFFEAEKKIADCILTRKEDVIEMTVAALARESNTSDATVSRFCRRCGFKGFHHLKINLAREVAKEKEEKMQVSGHISAKDIPQSLHNILSYKIAELEQTVSMMDTVKISRILAVIRGARMVQFEAVGNTIPVALDGAYKFNRIGIRSVSGSILETQIGYSFHLEKGDVMICISNSGTSRRLLSLTEGAKKRGVISVSVTNSPDSPLAQASDYHITTATREKLLTGERCFSRVSAIAVVEILYLLLASEVGAAMTEEQL